MDQQIPYDPYQQQVQQVPVSQDEIYANMLQEDRIKNIIAQISPDNQLYEIEMRIKGYRKNIQTGAWEKINPNEEEVNPLLVGRFISHLSSLLNQSTSISNLSAFQVNKIMGLVIEYIADDLDTNAATYGLETLYTERTRIGQIVLNATFMVLNRALNGQEARRMWGTLNISDSLGSEGRKQSSPFEFMKFWK